MRRTVHGSIGRFAGTRHAQRIFRLVVSFVLLLAVLPPTPAVAWTTGDAASWDTHDWIVNEASFLCETWGFTWVNLNQAIPASQSPDTSSTPPYICGPSEPGHANTQTQACCLYDAAVTAYRAGDFKTASTLAGTMGHLVADLGDPSFVGSWGATSTITTQWRKLASEHTSASLQNHGWVGDRPVSYSSNTTSTLAALRSRTARRANQLKPLAEAAAKNGWTLEARQLLALQLADTTRVVASLYASIAADAVHPVVPVSRVAGPTRYETAAQLALASYPSGTDNVVISSGAAWPDGMTGSSLAGALDAPLLLCKSTSVPKVVKDTIATLGARHVVLLGGTTVLSDGVARELDHLPNVTVERIAGPSRYSTARAVAGKVRQVTGKAPAEVFVATGADFADALAVSQITARRNSPIVLVKPCAPARDTVDAVKATGARRVYIVGGSSAVSPAVETALVAAFGRSAVSRAAGADRYETAVKILELNEKITGKRVTGVYLASGRVFADAIAGGPAAAISGAGLLLTQPVRLEKPATSALTSSKRRSSVTKIVVLGGTSALGDFIGFDALRAIDSNAQYPPAYSKFTPTVEVSYAYCEDTTGRKLGHYYNNRASAYTNMLEWPRDPYKIIQVDYDFFDAPVYNPVSIAQFALGAYDTYLETGDKTAKTDFIRHANWLRDKGMDEYGRFAYTWTYNGRGLTPPWYSGMAQGMGISALLRAYQLTNDYSYRRAAVKAFQPFTASVAGGGVTTRDGDDYWLEEYTEAQPKQVLNGSIFAMWGVWDLYRVTGDATAKSVFDRATATLKRHLDDYEYKGYCLYERYPGHYSNHYHSIHVRQLRALTGITGDLTFANRADKWTLIPKNPDENPKAVALDLSVCGISDDPLVVSDADGASYDDPMLEDMLSLGF